MSYRVVDLKEELEKRGLSKRGVKKDLVKRLGEYILENEAEDKADPPGPNNEMADVDAAPSIQIDTKLEKNDIVNEHKMMRQNQFKSASSHEDSSKTLEKRRYWICHNCKERLGSGTSVWYRCANLHSICPGCVPHGDPNWKYYDCLDGPNDILALTLVLFWLSKLLLEH